MNQGLAVIAGATTEMGSRIARELALHFSQMMLLGSDALKLEPLISGLEDRGCAACGHALDLHSPTELRRVVERKRGLLDRSAVLVCVGTDWDGGPSGQLSFEQLCPETISDECGTALAKQLFPVMIRRRYGRVIFLGRGLPAHALPAHSGVSRDNRLPGYLLRMARQVGRSRTTVNAISPVYTDAGPALDSMVRQLKYAGIGRKAMLNFLCKCEREYGSDYSQLIPGIAAGLTSPESEFINGIHLLMPLLARQAAA